MLISVFIASVYATILITCICDIYIQLWSLWWAIYRMPIGYIHDIYDWLLLYNIYITANVCAFRCMLVILSTHNILLLTKINENKVNNIYMAIAMLHLVFMILLKAM